jgi:hypothetical protein
VVSFLEVIEGAGKTTNVATTAKAPYGNGISGVIDPDQIIYHPMPPLIAKRPFNNINDLMEDEARVRRVTQLVLVYSLIHRGMGKAMIAAAEIIQKAVEGEDFAYYVSGLNKSTTSRQVRDNLIQIF